MAEIRDIDEDAESLTGASILFLKPRQAPREAAPAFLPDSVAYHVAAINEGLSSPKIAAAQVTAKPDLPPASVATDCGSHETAIREDTAQRSAAAKQRFTLVGGAAP